jgi:hypothetical protein
MSLSPRLLRPLASGRFLLDILQAEAAYSLRRLRTGYNGPAVQVRRSNDSAEQTFTPEQVAAGDLADWVGAGNDGFVTTWYDQTQNGQHVSQSTGSAQPKVVSNGALILTNSKPCINFDGTNDILVRSTATLGIHGPLFSVNKSNKSTGFQSIFRGGGISPLLTLHRFDASNFRTFAARSPNLDISTATTPTNHLLLFCEFVSSGANHFINNVAGTTTATTLPSGTRSPISVGGFTGFTEWFDGNIQEIVVFSSTYQSSSRSAITNNINAFYGIF